MIFVYAITTPANTPQSAPVVTNMELDAGQITHVDIQYPLGVSALANIQITDGLHQVFPTNSDGAFATSAETIGWNDDYLLNQPPYSLTAYSWNLDPLWPHTITVRFEIKALPKPTPDLAAEILSLLQGGTA